MDGNAARTTKARGKLTLKAQLKVALSGSYDAVEITEDARRGGGAAIQHPAGSTAGSRYVGKGIM